MNKRKRLEDLEFEQFVHEKRIKRCKSEIVFYLFFTLLFLFLAVVVPLTSHFYPFEVLGEILFCGFTGSFAVLGIKMQARLRKELLKERKIVETIKHKRGYLN